MNPNHRRGAVSGRGYTIVEMSIVLVVIGMLLGSILYPLSRRLEAEAYDSTRDLLQEAEKALVGYAMRSNTTSARVVTSGAGSVAGQYAIIPAGRAYLPCPDVDGDGVEDRREVISDPGASVQGTQINVADSGIGLELQRPGPVRRAAVEAVVTLNSTTSGSTVDGGFYDPGYGFCEHNTGFLPWVTLGLESGDYWGNAITYRPDPYWANSVIGFGPESRIDGSIMDSPAYLRDAQNLTLSSFQGPVAREVSFFPTIRSNAFFETSDIDPKAPAVVCTQPLSTLTVIQYGCGIFGQFKLDNTTQRIFLRNRSENYAVTSRTRDVHARITKSVGPIVPAYSFYEVYPHIVIKRSGLDVGSTEIRSEVLDGLAFVLVSHGKNARGAYKSKGDIPSTTAQFCERRLNSFGGLLPGSGTSAFNSVSDPEGANFDDRRLYDSCSNDQSYSTAFNNLVADTGFIERDHSDFTRYSPILGGTLVQTNFPFDDALRYMTGTQLISRMTLRGRDLGSAYIPPIVDYN